MHSTDPDYEAAGAEAERLAEAVKSAGTLEPVYANLDDAISTLTDEGYSPSDLLPATAEPGIGFSLNQKRDGKTLWQAIAVAGRERLCDPDGEVRKRLSQGTQAGSASLVTAVMLSLGLPIVGVPIAVSIVAVMMAIGIDGFCRWVSAPADEPATA